MNKKTLCLIFAMTVAPLNAAQAAVRTFAGLCSAGPDRNDVFAEFLPNDYDRNTVMSPSYGATNGYHLGTLLFLDERAVNEFINLLDGTAVTGHLQNQLLEIKKARTAFMAYNTQSILPECIVPKIP